MRCELINLKSRKDEEIDHKTVIFKIYAVNVFDLGASEDLELFMKTLIKGGVQKILVDMEGLEFIDSAGISVIVNAAKAVRSRKGDIALLNVPERIDKIFKPLHLHRFINIFGNENDALKFFKVFA